MNKPKRIQRALLSVFHKEGLDKIATLLYNEGVEMYSTGGTARYLEGLGFPVVEVASQTGYPSILGGRVKTLHPVVHGGILARRDEQEDQQELSEYGIKPIDLVIVDLYPFEKTVAEGSDEAAIIEKIDIGGIALIRAAAKNFQDVLVISSQEQYSGFEKLLVDQGASFSLDQRKAFAADAFHVSSQYDTHIQHYLTRSQGLVKKLRYGENPHQEGFFIGDLEELFEQLQGKALSYNNLVDIDAAVALVAEFTDPFFAVIKHTNACGCAIGTHLEEAWDKALAGDPVSAFGGILACNGTIDQTIAEKINALFFEVLIAQDFTEEAREIFAKKKNRILLRQRIPYPRRSIHKTVLNGIIQQDPDTVQFDLSQIHIQTTRKATEPELKDAWFADTICKHLKSNAICLVKDGQMIGSGVGQTSRIDALNQAIHKAKAMGFSVNQSVMASDAFFPFADCVTLAHEHGIEVVVEPGGSKRDQESINYCENQDMCLIFTGIRHFKH